jgi:hypothetical protein
MLQSQKQKEDSEATASGAEAPIDHRKRLFDEGLAEARSNDWQGAG